MSKSVLYASNSVAQTTTAAGTVINFGSIVRKYGCNLNLSGGNIITKGCGYYYIDTNFTINPTTAGLITITLYRDGVAIPGAVASYSATADEEFSLSIPAIIRQTCDCEKTITAVISGGVTSVTNAAIVVNKL